MVKNMCLNNAVHEVASDDAELPIDGRHRATGEIPRVGFIVRKGGIGMLEEGNPHYRDISMPESMCEKRDSPSQLLTHKYGMI